MAGLKIDFTQSSLSQIAFPCCKSFVCLFYANHFLNASLKTERAKNGDASSEKKLC